MSVREAFTKAFSTNVVSTHLFTEAMIPLLLASPSPRILFVSTGISSLGEHANQAIPVNKSPEAKGWPKPYTFNTTTYRTSKAAVNMMALEWCRTLKPDGVKIHIIDPGFLATALGGGEAAKMKEIGAQDPIVGGRFIRSIIESHRDAQVEQLVRLEGVVPW